MLVLDSCINFRSEIMNQWKIITFLSLLYLIWVVPQQSNAASLIQTRRILAQEGDKSNPKPIQEISPSPSPGPEVAQTKSGDDKIEANPHKTAEEKCDMNIKKCHSDVNNVTACLFADAGDASDGLVLLVHNDGETSVKLNVTLLPSNLTYNNTEIAGHQVKKVNVSLIATGSSSIVVNAGNWTCTIERVVRVPPSFPSYIAYAKPINGAYLLFATALFIGVVWVCCKFGRNGRHLNGVPYQELEMGQKDTCSSINTETVDGWDQSWDDDWDEEEAVKSPGGNHIGNRGANGLNSRSVDSNGWGNDWND